LRGWSPQNQSKTGYCHRLSPKSADYVIIMLSTKMKMKYVSGADPEMCWWRLCLWTTATAVSRSTNQPTIQPSVIELTGVYRAYPNFRQSCLIMIEHIETTTQIGSWPFIFRPFAIANALQFHYFTCRVITSFELSKRSP
jgi:hypothetical protein